jgi:hypothetical protein
MMVNENNFQFHCKSLFNFWKTIYSLRLFILVGTFVGIRHRRALEFVGSPNLPPKVFEFLISDLRIPAPLLESSHTGPDLGKTGRNLAIAAGFRSSSLESSNSSRNQVKVTGILLVSDRISSPVNFLYEPNAEK